MNLLNQELMRNLNITFDENESLIKYEEYYFNGLPFPKDFEFKDIESTKLKVFWKLEDINIINIDKNKIKYNIEIRKENEKIFNKKYETKETNYLINNLEKNTNYDIRICSIYNEVKGNFSELKKIKTGNTDSLILNESEKANEFLEKIIEWTGYKKLDLLYRGTRDGSGSDIFHKKCDNQGPTLILCKNEKNNIFGAYTSISWTLNSGWKEDNKSFLFTLTNIHNTTPTKYPITKNYELAVFHRSNIGPSFGGSSRGSLNHDLEISNNFLNNNESFCTLRYSYQDILGKGESTFSGDTNNYKFKLKEMEVFKLNN